jgi:adenylate cyclase
MCSVALNYFLTITEPPHEPRQIHLGVGEHDIGRDADCSITLQGLDISRRHARICLFEDGYTVEDLGSGSGTRVGMEALRAKRKFDSPQTFYLGTAVLSVAASDEAGERFTSIIKKMDVSSRTFLPLNGVAHRLSQRLEMLYELPLQFAAERDLGKLYSLILQRVIALIPGAERGALLIIEPASGKLVLRSSVPEAEAPISRTLIQRAAQDRVGFIWQEEEVMAPSLSMVRHQIRSGMYVPLLWNSSVVGVLCVDNANRSKAFREDDLRFLAFVAHYAASAVSNQLLQASIEQNNQTLQNLLTNFSPKLRGKLLAKSREGKLQPGGEKSVVTILMSDLRGFTQMSAGVDAADVVEMLNAYFSRLGDIIFQHDGTIDKFIGDAILAVFGSPEPDTDHAGKAVRCAVEMRLALQEINLARRAAGRPGCEIGIGVHTGEVLHGFIGAEERLEFTVIGDTVNKASRYCDGAQPGEILLGPTTWAAVQEEFACVPRGVPTKHEGELEGYLLLADA